MALILSIETSTPICSVALHEHGRILTAQHLFVNQSHSVKLTSLIQQVLANTDRHLHALDAIAVAKGPGSYTGLRIGTATAKGLCYSLSKPLIAVNSLEAMALAAHKYLQEDYLICPMIDARRMEVYCALYDWRMRTIQETEAKIMDEHSFKDILAKAVIVFLGDGAEKCKETFKHQSNARFVDNFYPTAESVGQLAFEAFKQNVFEDVAYFEPFYLKEFVTKVQAVKS